MKTLVNWLLDRQIEFRTVTTTEGKHGVMISTDYTGAHPTKEALDLQEEIAKKCSRLKLNYEMRGHYTAMLVTK